MTSRSAVSFVLLAAACAGGPGPGASPVTLGERRAAVPPPGLCRWYEGGMPLACDGIEYAAPLGSQILYRPDDRSRTVLVCFLSTAEPRRIIGMDLFNLDSGNLIEVVQRYGDEPPAPTCRAAYLASRR